MTNVTSLVGAALIATMTAVAARAAPVQSEVVDHDADLTRLVESFTRVRREFDQPKLVALITPDYVEVSPIGDVDTRDEMLSFYAFDKKRVPGVRHFRASCETGRQRCCDTCKAQLRCTGAGQSFANGSNARQLRRASDRSYLEARWRTLHTDATSELANEMPGKGT